jgi:hypothetical protein
MKKIKSLEAELIEENCARKRCNREKNKMETSLRRDKKWTKPQEEFTAANWVHKRRYYGKERKMETDVRSGTKKESTWKRNSLRQTARNRYKTKKRGR